MATPTDCTMSHTRRLLWLISRRTAVSRSQNGGRVPTWLVQCKGCETEVEIEIRRRRGKEGRSQIWRLELVSLRAARDKNVPHNNALILNQPIMGSAGLLPPGVTSKLAIHRVTHIPSTGQLSPSQGEKNYETIGQCNVPLSRADLPGVVFIAW